MSNRLLFVVPAACCVVSLLACSSRSTIAGATCDDSPPAATLRYPQSGARNVSTSLDAIVISGADGNRATRISLIDAGGTQTFIGPIERADRPPGAPDGVAYESAAVRPLEPGMSYIVLYSPIGCDGAMDYAIGSFSTME
jgi:hypothetical protein